MAASIVSTELRECEQVIERGLATFVEVGQALLRIRDGNLYRKSHGTFEDYCRERWGMDESYAYRQMQAAEIVKALPNGRVPSEAVARELAPLKGDPDAMREARKPRSELSPGDLQGFYVGADVSTDAVDYHPSPARVEGFVVRPEPVIDESVIDAGNRGRRYVGA